MSDESSFASVVGSATVTASSGRMNTTFFRTVDAWLVLPLEGSVVSGTAAPAAAVLAGLLLPGPATPHEVAVAGAVVKPRWQLRTRTKYCHRGLAVGTADALDSKSHRFRPVSLYW